MYLLTLLNESPSSLGAPKNEYKYLLNDLKSPKGRVFFGSKKIIETGRKSFWKRGKALNMINDVVVENVKGKRRMETDDE